MDLWHKNLETLRRVAPDRAEILARTPIPEDCRVTPSRVGPPQLQVGKQRLTSAYDPEKEGQEWAAAQETRTGEPLVIFGLGLGYHILPLLHSERPVWVVEPSPAVARLALEHRDLTALLARDGLRIGGNYQDLPRSARLLAHVPTRRLHPGPLRRLERFLAGELEEPGPMRILVISPLYGGSHPISRYVARGFQKLGHEAELLDFAPFYSGYGALDRLTADKNAALRLKGEMMRFLGEALLARVRDFHPDLVFALAQAPLDPQLTRRVKQEGPLVAYWFVEDFQVFPYWRDLAPEMDVFFTLQEGPFFQELKKAGAQNYSFLPLAADPEIYRPLDLSKEERRRWGSALSFVGAGYHNRRLFFQGLTDFDLKIWGSEWDLISPLGPFIQNEAARVSEEDSARIFNATRINLNLHSSPFHTGINPDGDYVNPRVFDLAACGAFQLVDRRLQLPQFFRPEEELATFASLPEAREKIDYYLAHDEQRLLLAQRGRTRLLQEHTYPHRLAAALETIRDLHPGRLPQRRATPAAGCKLQDQFPSGHPLNSLLEGFSPEESSDLSHLVERFRDSSEPLTEPEAIIWFLHEFRQGLQRGGF